MYSHLYSGHAVIPLGSYTDIHPLSIFHMDNLNMFSDPKILSSTSSLWGSPKWDVYVLPNHDIVNDPIDLGILINETF